VLDDLAAELVAEHHVAGRIQRPAPARLPRAVDELLGELRHVQVGAADAAAQRLHQRLPCAGCRIGHGIDDDVAVAEDRGAHGTVPPDVALRGW
jgi:hypothetical protein